MSLVASVAAGRAAVEELERVLAVDVQRGDVRWTEHQDLAVAWSASHRWVSSADDGDVLVVLDGQLHNLFNDDVSPADLLLRRYRDAGDELARGLRGDFVVIVLDRQRNTLLVARDPVGVRPWYQSTSGGRHAGATDAATLCRQRWVDDSVDEAEAIAYLADNTESRGPTFHRGISTLAPGTTWQWTDGAGRTSAHHRWEIEPEPDVTWDEAVERTREVVDEAVRSRVRAAGAATSDLSGGLDSSSIVGTLGHLGYEDVVVGRLLFQGTDADERRYSDAVIEHWGLTAVSATPWIPTDAELRQLAAELHRPPPEPNGIMASAMYRALLGVGRHTALTGLGGDEAFVARSQQSRVLSALQQRRFADLRGVLRHDLRHPVVGFRQTLRPVLGSFMHRIRRHPPAYLHPQAVQSTGLLERLNRSVPRLTGVAAVDERAHTLTAGYVAWGMEESATITDLHGWRSSHPFFDPRVITATYGLDPWFPVRDGHGRALQVAAFGDRLPAVVRNRRSKAEFSEVVWRGIGSDRPTAAVLLDGPLGERGWIQHAGLDELLDRVDRRDSDVALLYYRLVTLDRWMRNAG